MICVLSILRVLPRGRLITLNICATKKLALSTTPAGGANAPTKIERDDCSIKNDAAIEPARFKTTHWVISRDDSEDATEVPRTQLFNKLRVSWTSEMVRIFSLFNHFIVLRKMSNRQPMVLIRIKHWRPAC